MFSLPLSELRSAIVAIVLFAVFIGSAGYLGHGWYKAAGERDTALNELDTAREELVTVKNENADMRILIARQNVAVVAAANATTRAGELYTEAVKKNSDFRIQLAPLIEQAASRKSTNCEDALAHQRNVIDSLNKTKRGPQ